MTSSYLDSASSIHEGKDAPPNMTVFEKKGARLCKSQEKGMLSRGDHPSHIAAGASHPSHSVPHQLRLFARVLELGSINGKDELAANRWG
jgi:hypothetical protein